MKPPRSEAESGRIRHHPGGGRWERRAVAHPPLPVALLLWLGAFAGSVSGGDYTIDWWTVDGGGGTSSGESYSVSGTIGQPDAGPAIAGAGHVVSGGFWPVPIPVSTPGAPRLSITRTGPDHVTLSWSTGEPGWVLQQSGSFSPPVWSQTPGGAASPVTAPIGPGVRFYRLFRP